MKSGWKTLPWSDSHNNKHYNNQGLIENELIWIK